MTGQDGSEKIKIDNALMSKLMDVSEVHLNLSNEVIITTEDKVRLCLAEHLTRVEKKGAWVAPLGILIAIVVTLTTTTFKKIIFSAETWEAIFIISALISFCWLIRAIIYSIKSEKAEDIVDKLKKGSRSTNLELKNISMKFIAGRWENEWTVKGKKGSEICEIMNDGKYFINGRHSFSIEDFSYDIKTQQIKFIKAAVIPGDDRRLANTLDVVNSELLTGTEDDYEIRYTRI